MLPNIVWSKLYAWIYCCRIVSGDTSFTVFVGQAVNETDEIWQQISRRGVVRTGWNLAHWLRRPCCTSGSRLVNFAPGVPLGRQNTEGCKKVVTLFSYIVWRSAMKFDMMSPNFVDGMTDKNKCITEGLVHVAARCRWIPGQSSPKSGNKCRLARLLTLPNFVALPQKCARYPL